MYLLAFCNGLIDIPSRWTPLPSQVPLLWPEKFFQIWNLEAMSLLISYYSTIFNKVDFQGHFKVMANFDLDGVMTLKPSIFWLCIVCTCLTCILSRTVTVIDTLEQILDGKVHVTRLQYDLLEKVQISVMFSKKWRAIRNRCSDLKLIKKLNRNDRIYNQEFLYASNN